MLAYPMVLITTGVKYEPLLIKRVLNGVHLETW